LRPLVMACGMVVEAVVRQFLHAAKSIIGRAPI
jgi:hypothetical protein